uniref:Thyrotropin-releasing hormone receptor n=1 Tax=Panagrolaimus sp. JU765 TaxID=591449 RepID=A0AC34QL24_9BILA
MNLPYLIAVQYIEYEIPGTTEKFGICTRSMSQVNVLQVVTTLNLIVWYLVPLSILLIIYVTIGIVLMKSTEDNSVTRSSQSNSARSSNKPTTERKMANIEAVDSRKRVIKLVVVIVSSFALLSLPRYLYLTWSVWRETNAPRCLNCLTALIQPTTFLLLFINSGINPILYAFLSQRFRSAIVDTLTCAHSKEKRKNHILMKLRKTRCSENGGGGYAIGMADSPRRSPGKQPLPMLEIHNDRQGLINAGYGANDSPIETNLEML